MTRDNAKQTEYFKEGKLEKERALEIAKALCRILCQLHGLNPPQESFLGKKKGKVPYGK